MKLEISIIIAFAFLSLSVQAVYCADAIDGGKILPKASLLEKSEKVNLLPLALQPGGEETNNFKFNKQQQEMADLWDATLARSQDIQFVIQKLMPSNNNGQAAGMAMKMISTAVFGGMGAGMMMVPNMGTQMPNMSTQTSMCYIALTDANLEPSYPVEGGQSLPYLLPSMANAQGLRMSKKARLNETESIRLYTIVRHTAETLVSNYKDYSQAMHEFADADAIRKALELAEPVLPLGHPLLTNPYEAYACLAVHDTDDAGMKHALACRVSLVGLAGEEAVTRLDESNGFTKLIKQFEVKSQ